MEKRSASNFSDTELLQIGKTNQELSRQIRSVFKQGIEGMYYDMGQVQRILAEFTARGATLMTVASLFAILPVTMGYEKVYLAYFLMWTFPFLLVSIIFFYLSSKRANITRSGSLLIPEGLPEELVLLRAHFVGLEEICRQQYSLYQESLIYYRYSSTAVYSYVISFVLNYYFFVFFGEPPLFFAMMVFVFCWGFGVYLIWLREKGSQSKAFGSSFFEPDKENQTPSR